MARISEGVWEDGIIVDVVMVIRLIEMGLCLIHEQCDVVATCCWMAMLRDSKGDKDYRPVWYLLNHF
jgi:hypothetical protein